MKWCFRAYANFADFSGCARRTEFAMFFVTTFFLFFLLMAAQEKLGKFGEILTWLFLLTSSVPALSVLIIPIRIRNETRRRAKGSAIARQGEVDKVSFLMRIGIRK